ncbi:MAG: hypothetical protein WBO16_13100 [Gammaproteobacteria bacterium]
MRVLCLLLTCLMLIACGKTGALYLPEDAETQQQSTDTDTDTEAETEAETETIKKAE